MTLLVQSTCCLPFFTMLFHVLASFNGDIQHEGMRPYDVYFTEGRHGEVDLTFSSAAAVTGGSEEFHFKLLPSGSVAADDHSIALACDHHILTMYIKETDDLIAICSFISTYIPGRVTFAGKPFRRVSMIARASSTSQEDDILPPNPRGNQGHLVPQNTPASPQSQGHNFLQLHRKRKYRAGMEGITNDLDAGVPFGHIKITEV